MKINLRVDVDGMYWSGGAVVEVPELLRQQFEPIDICDDPTVRYCTGGISEAQAKVVIKTREDAAKILAEQLTAMIVAEMGKNDTRDGYRQDG